MFQKKLAVVLFSLALGLPLSLWAYAPVINIPTVPYEVLAIEARIEQERIYLGELKGDPHMYEFGLGEPRILKITLVQRHSESPLPLSLIVVKSNDNNRGVAEVGRIQGKDVVWESYRDSVLGLKLSRGETFTAELAPGIYRFEVSTAENLGKYMLVIGEEPEATGYFARLKEIRTIQAFFGVSWLALLGSSYVYYLLGIILLVGLLYLTWQKRDIIRQIKTNA